MLKVSPNDPATNYLRSLAAYQSKDYQTAKTHSENALRVARNHRPSMFIAGAANYGLGQYEQAFRHLSSYVHEVPTNLEARKLLAATQMKMGQAEKAVGTLQAGTRQPGGEDAQLLAMIGAASAQAGDVRGANRCMERAVAQDPTNPALRARLGATQIALGNVAEGMDELEKAAQQDPAGAADITLIAAHLRAKEWDKALEAARRLQQKQPASASGYMMEGLAESGRGNFAAAKAAFEKAREVKPQDRAPVKYLAALAIQQNDFDEARRLYREFLTRVPGDVEFLLLSAQLEERAGRREEMVRFAEEAVKHNPDNKFAKLSLARVYLFANEPRKVMELLQADLQAGGADPANFGSGRPRAAGARPERSGDRDLPRARQRAARGAPGASVSRLCLRGRGPDRSRAGVDGRGAAAVQQCAGAPIPVRAPPCPRGQAGHGDQDARRTQEVAPGRPDAHGPGRLRGPRRQAS